MWREGHFCALTYPVYDFSDGAANKEGPWLTSDDSATVLGTDKPAGWAVWRNGDRWGQDIMLPTNASTC
ncbi:hypothetical protein GCM10028824_41890 [Hymenobacter segetis]